MCVRANERASEIQRKLSVGGECDCVARERQKKGADRKQHPHRQASERGSSQH